jgi:DUF4097 and DUF4098 domain-containing protein YvlB
MRKLVLLAMMTAPMWAIETLETIEWEWHGSLARGNTIEIRGVTGDIVAEPSTSDRIEVTAQIDGAEQTENVEIRAFQSHGGVTVCAVRKGSSECDEKLLSAPGTRVNYKVQVPSGVHLAARTVNGAIAAHRLSSDVQAATVNGQVSVSTSGTVHATTVNGSIDAALLHGIWTKAPEFSAVNGKIRVGIPGNLASSVNAETRNGRIVASVPSFKGTATEQVLTGTIGRRGGSNCSPIMIRTVNGSIELRQNF